MEEFRATPQTVPLVVKRINDVMFALGVLTVLLSVYVVIEAYVDVPSLSLITLPIMHIGLTATIATLTVLRRKRTPVRWAFVLVLLVLAYVGLTYLYINQGTIYARLGFQTPVQVFMMFSLMLILFTLSWLMFGPVFAVSAGIFMAYVYVGDSRWLPDLLRTADVTFKRATATLSFQAIGGQIIAFSAQFLFMLLVMGALLQSSGGAAFIWGIARGLTRRIPGGSGLVTVISSSTVATFTGGGAANAGITGVVTIPMMMKTGYTPEKAAGIEAVASVAGAITPPVLGAAAFIMADFVGVTYIDLVVATAVPAFLFYLGLAAYISLTAQRDHLSGSIDQFIPQSSGRQMLVAGIQMVVPMTVLVALLVQDKSVELAVFWTIVTILVVWAAVYVAHRLGFADRDPAWKTWRSNVLSAMVLGAGIAMAASTLDVMLSAITQTGIGLRVASLVSDWGQGNIVLTLLIAVGLSYFLGLGLPPLPVYVITAVLLAPALVKIGAAVLVAHYVMYYTGMVFPNLNPPVASTVLVTGQMAGANYMKASIEATKYAGGAMYLPFLVFFAPELLLVDFRPVHFVHIFVVTGLAIFVGQAGLAGYFGGRQPRLVRAVSLAAPMLAFVFLWRHVPSAWPTGLALLFELLLLGTFVVSFGYALRGLVFRRGRTPARGARPAATPTDTGSATGRG